MKHKETGRALHLVLKRKWYEMIEQGVKTAEYREVKPYYMRRLRCCAIFPQSESCDGCAFGSCHGIESVCLHRGYTSTTMTFKIRQICIGYGNPELGAPTDREVFIIRLGERIG